MTTQGVATNTAADARAFPLFAVWLTVAVLLFSAGGLSVLASSVAVLGGPYHPTADKCQLDDPAPEGAAMSGEQRVVTGGASSWPVGYACTYTMEDGSFRTQGLDDWTATWLAYGGLTAVLGGVALAIGSSVSFRRRSRKNGR
ncbi:hypothetical protein [Glaciihabitans sp. dw_435]|uniref:hypothetical protein n=1 Tax=Glaciihabitans sp. dw_435 TaxID=2720081 RepID=UPI001BD4951C|nr:hypothetical protein [Glaciihabitans sp. dw_435]